MQPETQPPHDSATGEVLELSTQSRSLAKLGDALAKAQGEMRNASKETENPYFHSRYADLASVWDAIRAPLSKHGLAVIQQVTTDAKSVTVTSTLVHASGEFIRDRCSLPVLPMSKKARDGTETPGPAVITPQAYGSAITYARRYSLSALVGVAPDDDDGNAASASQGAVSATRSANGREEPHVEREEDSEPKIPYGNSKGQLVSKAKTDDLEFLQRALGDAIDNPEKARFKASNERLLVAVEKELERRV